MPIRRWIMAKCVGLFTLAQDLPGPFLIFTCRQFHWNLLSSTHGENFGEEIMIYILFYSDILHLFKCWYIWILRHCTIPISVSNSRSTRTNFFIPKELGSLEQFCTAVLDIYLVVLLAPQISKTFARFLAYLR